ncbi:hypothetical protein [Sagittula salina]|uniref:Uncharacterized protein n=1 Tax=Sagittula salina TaxID=2820268 RepID=A0A940S571_9RHOB|nr:hypothetical protein [Sagittula salina]MBP0484670.1 hypothetical protein [Sagittula salina]
MKIESIIQREHGTRVTLDTTAYHFMPERPNGPHVAEVEDEDHVDTFLAIREGYRPATETVTAIPEVAAPVTPKQEPEPEKAKEPEPEPAQAPEKEPEKAEEPEAEAEPAKEPKKDAGGPPYSEAMLNEMTEDELAEEFKRLRGRKPHGNSARDTVIEVILENYAPSGE